MRRASQHLTFTEVLFDKPTSARKHLLIHPFISLYHMVSEKSTTLNKKYIFLSAHIGV